MLNDMSHACHIRILNYIVKEAPPSKFPITSRDDLESVKTQSDISFGKRGRGLYKQPV